MKQARQPTPELVQAIADLLWDCLCETSEHQDRRQTTWGNKTRLGLAATILRVVDEQMAPVTAGGAS